MEAIVEQGTPQWKRDLILRIKKKHEVPSNERQQQLLSGTPPRCRSDADELAGQQPSSLTHSSDATAAVPVVVADSGDRDKWNGNVSSSTCPHSFSSTMVQECTLLDHKHYGAFDSIDNILENGSDKSADSSSSEELHYGPGIVSKLKNRYLSLTLRENNAKARPSILSLRKATSLENLIEDEAAIQDASATVKPAAPVAARLYHSRYRDNHAIRNGSSTNNRYYNTTRVGDLKRARSVEAISSVEGQLKDAADENRAKHRSLHEDVLIVTEGSGDKLAEKSPDSAALIPNKGAPSENHHQVVASNIAPGARINRPKRIAPMMSEKEKPPADLVKQTKRIFERSEPRAKLMIHHTGEVAAKVATYKNIIGQTKSNNAKKPPITTKQKPVAPDLKIAPNVVVGKPPPSKLQLDRSAAATENGRVSRDSSGRSTPTSPSSLINAIPDVSRISGGPPAGNDAVYRAAGGNQRRSKPPSSLSETPDLILDSSPNKHSLSPTFKILATDNFLKAEITNSTNSKIALLSGLAFKKTTTPSSPIKRLPSPSADDRIAGDAFSSPPLSSSPLKSVKLRPSPPRHSPPPPPTEKEPSCNDLIASALTNLKPTLKTERGSTARPPPSSSSPAAKSPTSPPPAANNHLHHLAVTTKLSPQEIEKNKLNTAKSLEQRSSPSPPPFFVKSKPQPTKIAEEATAKKTDTPVKKTASLKSKQQQQSRDQNSIVFKFTDRKDVPDYVGNDGRIRTGKIEKPRVGEGGIIILPGVSLDESFVDDEEWKLSLESPPSPCNVIFINDNVLIDGRSSLSQKSKKSKMSIKFVEAVPDIFEYPSEASLLSDFSPALQDSSPNHTLLGGTSLGNYIPKVGSTEEFQLGITRSSPISIPMTTFEDTTDSMYSAIEEPVLFSSGNNSDILF